jgi:hypothetical protein
VLFNVNHFTLHLTLTKPKPTRRGEQRKAKPGLTIHHTVGATRNSATLIGPARGENGESGARVEDAKCEMATRGNCGSQKFSDASSKSA